MVQIQVKEEETTHLDDLDITDLNGEGNWIEIDGTEDLMSDYLL